MIFVMICVVSFLGVVFLIVIVLYWVMNYGGSYSFFSFFFFLLGWSNSPKHCLPEWPCWYCENVVKERSKCWSPNEGKWKKWYLWWFVWFLSLELSFWLWLFFVLSDEWIMIAILILFFFSFFLGWNHSPIHCLPTWPCWYCDDVVKERSKCWSPNEGKWKKWYLWWFVWFLSLELSFWLWLFFVLSDEWIMIAILILFFFFFFFLLGWNHSPIHCLPEWPCWYCENVVKERSKCWSPNEGKWKKWYLWWFVWFLSLELSFWLWLFCTEWWMNYGGSYSFFFFFLHSFRMEQLPYSLPARRAVLILWKCCSRKKQTLMPNGR